MTRLAAIFSSIALLSAVPIDWSAVAPDIEQRLARFKPIDMPFNLERFSAREKILISELIAASRDLEAIYWRQNSPDDIEVYNALASSKEPRSQALRRYLWINGSRYDQIEENRSFIGGEPMPPGRNLYPRGLTRADIEAYVTAHPHQKKAIYDERTVVELVGRNPLKLSTTPYHVKYRRWLEPAAAHLRKAATASSDKAFAAFLRSRAKALTTDDYYPSDLQWVGLQNPTFDIIFAPYETYLDDLLGVKTSYGAAVMVRNEEESRKVAVFQKYVPDIQDALPLAAADRPSKKGHATPMEVMDTPFRAGDLRHGYQAVADNLPNDPRIHEKVGSKKIFFKNYMDARVDDVILPIAKRLMRPDQAARASAEGYLTIVLMHEISHGLGPAFARRDGRQVDISAIARDTAGRYGIDYAKLPDAIAAVTKELLEIEATGDRERAESWFARYDKMPAELRSALDAAKDVPIDIDPRVAFLEGVN